MLLALIITALLFGLANFQRVQYKIGRAGLVQAAGSAGMVLLSTGLLAYAFLG